MKHYICNLFEIRRLAIPFGLLLLSMNLSAAEYRVPMEGIRRYDNSQDWFLTHEDAYPMAGEAADNLAEFSSSVWFCIEKLPHFSMERHRDVACIFSRGWSQELRLMPAGSMRNHYCCTDGETYTPVAKRLRVGHWTHVVVTFSVAQQKVISYVDGIKQGVYEGKLYPVRPSAAGCKLTVGQSAENWNPFDGQVADIRWFDHALTEQEVQQLFQNPLPEVAEKLAQDTVYQQLIEIYPVAAPLGDGMILPMTTFPKGTPQATECRVTLAAGEYEPAALALHAPTEELGHIWISIAADDAAGTPLPAEWVNLRYVQCWYQAGSAWQNIEASMDVSKLVPELLVKDPNLVTVDFSNANQSVKLGGETGRLARDIHARSQVSGSRWDLHYPVDDNNDIRDAKTLQPLRLLNGMTRELFITVHAPEDAAPGPYTANLEIRDSGILLRRLPLNVTVLPFPLATPRRAYDLEKPFIPSLYYVNGMDPSCPPELNPMHRSEPQIAAELANLKAHGIDNPFNYQLQTTFLNLDLLRVMLRMRAAAGLSNRPAFLHGPEGNMSRGFDQSEEALAFVRQKVRDIIAVVKEECGHDEVYFYGVDEASAEKVAQQRPLWDAIHEAGGRIMTSDCSPQRFAADIDGKVLDLVIMAWVSSAELAAKRHATGGLIFSYGNPQGGVENPLTYRRNYGIQLWKRNYDGFATYCYYEAFGHPWDDFDSMSYRDHNLVYPTADGIIDTLAWEGFREAVDDIRYASTLALAIRDNPNHPQAAAAKAFLDGITGKEPDLDALRRDIISWILKLR